MNELDFPIRLLEVSEDNTILMIYHEDNIAWGNNKEAGKTKRDKTRQFCNWLRKQFPHIPTEFRFVNKRRVRNRRYNLWSSSAYQTVNTDKHFVAYGLKRSEMLMIKLAWVYEAQPVRLSNWEPDPKYRFTIESDKPLEPTDALKARIAAKSKPKLVKVSC